MGGAIVRGFLKMNTQARLTIIKPSPLPDDLGSSHQIEYFPDTNAGKAALENTQLVILAVKPQTLPDAVRAIQPYISSKTLVVSIAAGTEIETLESLLSSDQPIIRVMPNTPALIGKASHVACANAKASKDHALWVNAFFEASGHLFWIDDDALMNAVTALSGSGPAYVFYMIEALEKAGINNGLPEDLAKNLARQTVVGAAALAENQPHQSAAALRTQVTSPGGTTEAALNILMNGELQALFDEAIKNAIQRGKDLNQSK